jgi:hypothetical protein
MSYGIDVTPQAAVYIDRIETARAAAARPCRMSTGT